MKICALDTKYGTRWNKKWESLCSEILIYEPSTFESKYQSNNFLFDQENNKFLLLIIHQSVLSEQLLNRLKQGVDKQILPYIMIVSNQPLDGSISEDGKIHESSIALKNQTDLSYLSTNFNDLVDCLKKIDASASIQSSIVQRVSAWNNWSIGAEPDIPIAVYILCQCYLHLYYSQSNKPQETTHPQILELLKNQELFDRPSDDKFKTAQSSNWWKEALSSKDSEDLSWGKIKSKGEKQWQSLIKAQDDRANVWEDLISQINKEEDVEISFENVETYYLKMHTILSAK
jgi:hypothetical protein